MVDGFAVGAGCNIPLGCDLVLASDRARSEEVFLKAEAITWEDRAERVRAFLEKPPPKHLGK